MKFKVIFIAFNLLIVLSFLMIFLMPVFMLGGDYASAFWKDSWYIAVIFAVIIICINAVYLVNRRLLSLLENEDWPGLKAYLDRRLFSGRNPGKLKIRLYINTCLALSVPEEIKRLEEYLMEHKPSLVDSFALAFGLPYLLKEDMSGAREFYGGRMGLKSADSGWIKWNYCFTLLMLDEKNEAKKLLSASAQKEKEPVLRLVTLYMLSPFRNDEESRIILESGCAELREKYKTVDSLLGELEKHKENVQMLFLSRIVREAADWLFREEK